MRPMLKSATQAKDRVLGMLMMRKMMKRIKKLRKKLGKEAVAKLR